MPDPTDTRAKVKIDVQRAIGYLGPNNHRKLARRADAVGLVALAKALRRFAIGEANLVAAWRHIDSLSALTKKEQGR